MQIYCSWCPGLEKDKEAMRILKESGIIKGIEIWNTELVSELRKSGLSISVHNPLKNLRIDLTNESLMDELGEQKNKKMIDYIRCSDAPVAGFHIYYKSQKIDEYLMKGIPINEPLNNIKDIETIKETTIKNLLSLEKEINKDLPLNRKKKIMFETYPYINLANIAKPGTIIPEEFKKATDMIALVNTEGFIKAILEDPRIKKNSRIGFLFDISHIFVALNTMAKQGIIHEPVDDYMRLLIKATAGRTYQLHLNTPKQINDSEYIDYHGEFTKSDKLSKRLLGFAKQVLKANPQLSIIALEIYTNPDPVSHAKKLVEQAKMIKKELNI